MAASGDVIVRRDDACTYFVVDGATKAVLVGPFGRHSYALGVAQSLAVKRGGRVLAGLHYDLGVLEARLREALQRVDRLAAECREAVLALQR